jgi:hypothetical protein
VLGTLSIPLFHVRQLDAQDGSLDGVETAIPSHLFVQVAARTAVIAETAHALGGFSIIADHETAIAVSAQILAGIETEGGRFAHRARTRVAPARSDGLSRVFKHGNPEFSGEAGEGVHVDALAVEMDGQQRTQVVDSPARR